MSSPARSASTESPVALGSFRSWLKLLRHSQGVDRAYIPRALQISLSSFLTTPLRLYESLRYGRAVRRTAIHPAPVFIIGHWRTGTTHLHNLLCQDKSFGWVSTFQTIAPGFFLMGRKTIAPFLERRARKTHPTRLIDNIPLWFDAPQEEEFAIANLSPYSLIHQYTFPRQAPYFFERYTLFDGLSEPELAAWTEIYLGILRKATLSCGGKRLLLKSPNNSARIRKLLELFPDAKFIHTYRNPYHVFCSTMVVYRTVLPLAQIQDITWEEVENYVLRFYRRLMQRFLVQKPLIPPGRLVEVRFEDLERAPLAEVKRVYETLDLPGFPAAEAAFRNYLSSTAGYRKNEYEVEDRVIAKVNREWDFAFAEWGYERREPGGARSS